MLMQDGRLDVDQEPAGIRLRGGASGSLGAHRVSLHIGIGTCDRKEPEAVGAALGSFASTTSFHGHDGDYESRSTTVWSPERGV